MLARESPAVTYGDFFVFSPSVASWTPLSPSGTGPSARWALGFATGSDGRIWAFGGEDSSGGE